MQAEKGHFIYKYIQDGRHVPFVLPGSCVCDHVSQNIAIQKFFLENLKTVPIPKSCVLEIVQNFSYKNTALRFS